MVVVLQDKERVWSCTVWQALASGVDVLGDGFLFANLTRWETDAPTVGENCSLTAPAQSICLYLA